MRRQTKTIPVFGVALAGLLGAAGCDLDVPDLNNPGLESLVDNPNVSSVGAACTGLLIGSRAGTSAPNGFVSQLGILGRESYNFDGADTRYHQEMLQGTLQPGSPFGGAFWTGPYANIRLANIILDAAEALDGYDAGQKAAIRGYAHTIQAMDFYRIIVTRDTIGAAIDVDTEIDNIDELAPIAERGAVYARIAELLDDAASDLDAASAEFPFQLSSGFGDFNTPTTFRQFNRALRARIAVYQEDWATANAALDESFLDPAGDFALGAYFTFTTGTGDVQNGLINPNIFAHPSFVTDAQDGDTRVTTKLVESAAGSAGGNSSNLKFTLYPSPTSSVPIIRNEELILLRAEAAWGAGDLATAIENLDVVRAAAGLPALAGGLSADEVEEEILYNRRYSLMFEGGHRWIDLKRHGRTEKCGASPETTGTTNCIPDEATAPVINLRYPIPQAECDARGGTGTCGADTTVL